MAMYTNWIAVKMLFYPIEYMGTEWYREPFVPYGIFGWQGVVPCKTEKMASRLVDIVTNRLLSIEEVFGRLDASQLATLLLPVVEEELRKEGGRKYEIADILDLRSVVLQAFMRDKVILVELFQKVGRVELDFLVESGLGFGFILGLVQMIVWVSKPKPWTLPVAGAIVGYATNWIAIKLLFDPVEPVQCGPIVVQGLFESRQVEVSDEFGTFMAKRVLNSGRLLEALAQDSADGKLYSFLRRQLPHPVPEFILTAAVRAIGSAAKNQHDNPDLHQYMTTMLNIESTLAHRLKLLSPSEFEDLLHPVFQEDETILIAAGGVFGGLAGLGQTQLGWGGPGATMRALITLVAVSVSSLGYFLFKEVIEEPDEVIVEEAVIVIRPVQMRRRNTLVKVTPKNIPDWVQIPEFR